MPVTLQHIIGTITLLALTISLGLSFSIVASFVQTDINEREMTHMAEYVSLNLIEISTLTSSSNYNPITVVKIIELPTELRDRAYNIALVDATDEGKGYLVRVSLVAQPHINVESAIPLNSTATEDQLISINPPWLEGETVPNSKPAVIYTKTLYGGSDAVVWTQKESSNIIYMGIGYLKTQE